MANYDEEQEKGESGLDRSGEEAKRYAGDKAKEKLSGKGAKEAGKGTAKQAAKEGGKKAAKEGAKKASMAAGPEAYAAVEAADQAQELARHPEKALKKSGSVIGAVIAIVVASVIAAVLIVVVIAVTFLAFIFGAVEIGEAIPQDPPPIMGDGTGLLADYCIRMPLVPPPYPDADTDEEKCSQALRNLFIVAGKWAKVPAGVIAGVASIEGKQIFGYTDDKILEYSEDSGGTGIDGQGIDPVNSTPNSCSAIGPMQMTIDYDPDYPPVTFSCGVLAEPPFAWDTYKTAANKAGVVSIPNPDARNIKNAIYGAAWLLKCRSGVPVEICNGANFADAKYDYNDSDDDWEGPPGDEGEADGSAGEAWLAAKGYYGSCGKNYCQNVWDYYQTTKDSGATGIPGDWPNSGFISQGPYSTGTHQGEFASSIDVDNDVGIPVFSTQGGNLVFKKLDDTGALDVIIEGSKYRSYYVHLSELSSCIKNMVLGEFVPAGELVGFVGDTGDFASKPHTHYMINDLNGQPLPESEFRSLLPDPDVQVGDTVTTTLIGVKCKP